MSWYKVDDRLPTSRKLMRIPRSKRAAAIGVWTLAGAWSTHDLTDGFVPAYAIEEWGGDDTHAQALVDAGMWEPDERDGDPGYQFVNWDEYQPTKADVEEKRERDRERKRNQKRDGGGKFAGRTVDGSDSARKTSESDGKISDSTVPVPSRPVPSRPEREADGEPSSPHSSRKKPSRPIPDNWTPSPSHIEKCATEHIDLDHEAEKFRNNALAKDMRYANWDRAFTNWLSREWVKRTSAGIDPMKDW